MIKMSLPLSYRPGSFFRHSRSTFTVFVEPRIFLPFRPSYDTRRRNLSRSTTARGTVSIGQDVINTATSQIPPRTALAKVKTTSLFRSFFLGYVFSSPYLLNASLRLMSVFVNPKSSFLHLDKNPIFGAVLRALVYNHFCAGSTPSTVRRSVEEAKALGFSGVILGYSREILPEDVAESTSDEAELKAIESWKRANLDTLSLIGSGDHMFLKMTGAGEGTSRALLESKPPSKDLITAFEAICEQAVAQGSSVWIDGEPQPYQDTLNDWAINLMRRWNVDGKVVVYNTIQAYLKTSRKYVTKHLEAAQAGDWTCAIKLVRGAYIQNDIRERIWDTKAQTDECYNSIVRDILTKNFDGIHEDQFPKVRLFVAGHNKESVRLATKLVSELVNKGEDIGPVQYGQIQGMADEVSHELVRMKDAAENKVDLSEVEKDKQRRATPQPFKCMIWGSVNDCLGFLMRRAIENATAAERLKEGMQEVRQELKRRILFR